MSSLRKFYIINLIVLIPAEVGDVRFQGVADEILAEASGPEKKTVIKGRHT